MTKTTQQLKCSNTHGHALKAAAAFPQRLAEVHMGRISLRADAVYAGSNVPIAVICNTCGHKWNPWPNNLVNNRQGCPECKRQQCRDRAGKIKATRASKAMKAFAAACRDAGMTLEAIASLTRRSVSAVNEWSNPVARAKSIAKNRAYREQNRERVRAGNRRYKKEHGRSADHKAVSKRRALQANTVFDVEVDGLLTTINMWECIDKDPVGQALFEVPGSGDAFADYSRRAKLLSKIAGVPYHVDHLVPLSKGGLHCAENFALRPASENISKNNTVVQKDYALFAKRIFGIAL